MMRKDVPVWRFETATEPGRSNVSSQWLKVMNASRF